ncbi:MAG: DUF2092 domain-containing protein [Oscillatoriales cyanobacterium RM2_1_1]|nr:DUF2092 domain-containing protein [Oscillatoriales cyanobacterium SM2_3_0]NJO45779.1 DUF2092 domain-containing protein [Oscillatoriales cyanobacterium RM2_1_1]
MLLQRYGLFAFLVVLSIGFSPTTQAQQIAEITAQRTVQRMDKQAETYLQEMGDTLQNASEFTFQAETTVIASRSRDSQEGSGVLDVMVQRSSGLRADQQGDRDSRSFWYDGRSITLLDRLQNTYATASAPTNMDDALDYAVEEFGIRTPLVDLLFSNPYEVLTENIQTGTYRGIEQVGSKKCHHLAFTQANVDWEIWVADDADRLPCKVMIDYKNLPSRPKYTAILTDWNLNPDLSKIDFTFQPPSGAMEIEFLRRR